jgi:DNA-binding NarL/FixJ family response regulator
MATAQHLRFVIADDHQMYLDAVKAILEENGFRVIGEASDGVEALRLCRDLEPDIAVLDISMPRLNGIDAAREIKRVSPSIKIILLTIHAADQYILESLRAGAAAYVTKSDGTSSLLKAIHAAYSGETYVSPGAGSATWDHFLS